MIRTLLVQGGIVAAHCVSAAKLTKAQRREWLLGPDAEPQAELPPGDLVEVSGAAAEAPIGAGWRYIEGRFQPPQVTADPAAVTRIVNDHVEAVARSMGYSSAASCAGYLGSTVPQWAAEAGAFVAWRDAVWLAVFKRKDEPPPATVDAVLALLPAWVPPA